MLKCCFRNLHIDFRNKTARKQYLPVSIEKRNFTRQNPNMNEKVLVTGINIISSLGLNLQENIDHLMAGRSGISRIRLFDPSGLETQIAGQLPEAFDELAAQTIKRRMRKQMTRVTQMHFTAVKELLDAQANGLSQIPKDRCAVVSGVIHTANNSAEKDTTAANTIIKGMNNAMPAWVAQEFGFQGPAYAITAACASSAFAVAAGCDLIRSGRADMVVVAGADSTVNREEIAGFNAIYALSTRNDAPEKASRPFSADRDGFVIGEGAGVIILEGESSALRRGAEIYAELAGYKTMSEAYNIMAPKTDGEGMAQCMSAALKDAGISPEAIGYINAHGTSTTLNDLYETKAIKKVFGKHAGSLAVSSSKSMLGHTIGAAGVIEAGITAWSVRHNKIHPTINLDTPDPELNLDYVPEGAREKQIHAAISNSFGFGGHNSSLVFRKYE